MLPKTTPQDYIGINGLLEPIWWTGRTQKVSEDNIGLLMGGKIADNLEESAIPYKKLSWIVFPPTFGVQKILYGMSTQC